MACSGIERPATCPHPGPLPEGEGGRKAAGSKPLGIALILILLLGLNPCTRADGPLPPGESASRMTVPEGFHVTLFASEPDVRQPIAFAIDPRGRLWVVENFSYPNWRTKPEGKDRIIILEDVNGDGKFDTRKVFYDRGANLTGLALGFGGVWVCDTPNLIFIPDKDGDDVPDGEPTVELDGWDVKGQHNLFNGLNWGPDGWLHGCNGILSNSKVGRPGTPDADRVSINCGVWRYHPTRKVFEVVAHGTTNPWGLDFDDHGQAFITNCVIPHLYRVVPGARFQRMFGQDFNPFTYERMGTTADHIHWAGGAWTDSRGGQGKHGEAGGGHAHVGAMIYLGDNWPDRYRDTLFTCNLHGNRVNNDALRREGSGYVATHSPDFLKANDSWFRGLELKYGPDGGVYLTDWSDTAECHDTDADGPHRENGRIYKVTYGTPRVEPVDLAGLDSPSLARLQSRKNDWFVRTARLILQDRAASGAEMGPTREVLRRMFEAEPGVPTKLRAFWALYATGGLDEPALVALLGHDEEWVRAWSVRLLVDARRPSAPALARLESMAKSDPSPLVRLELASAAGKLPVDSVDRRIILEGLITHAEDARDASLPLLTWYGFEPMVPLDRAAAVSWVAKGRIATIRRFLARRIVSVDDAEKDGRGIDGLVGLLAETGNPSIQLDILEGLREAYRGRKSTAIPERWPAVLERLSGSSRADVRNASLALALQFDDPRAVTILQATLADGGQKPDRRLDALRLLSERRVPGLAPRLLPLLDQAPLRGAAFRALAGYDDGTIPGAILGLYPRLDVAERRDAIATLASRPSYALALLEAIRGGVIPRRDLSATTARELLAIGDPKVSTILGEVWGSIRPTSTEKAPLMAKYKTILPADRAKAANPSKGRSVFQRTCVACHKLFDEGGDVGPELTGSDRKNLDYVLENVLDPNASVPLEYRLNVVALDDGRVLSGLVTGQDEKTLTIRTANDRIVLAREDISEFKPSNLSMMPEGLFEKLTDDEVRDLVAYLASPGQVPPRSRAPDRRPSGV